MKILLATQTFVGSSGWHIERVLAKMGHAVRVSDPGSWLVPPYKGRYTLTENIQRQMLRIVHRLPPVRAAIIAANNRRLLRESRLFQPDLLLVIKGEQINPETITDICRLKIRAINWCFDDPFRWIDRADETIAAYDYFLTVDQTYIEKAQARLPNAQVGYLPQCCDPDVHRTFVLTPTEQEHYGNDVCFVGSMYLHRVSLLRDVAKFDFGIWGGFWDRASDPNLRSCYRGREVYGMEKTYVFNASKIILNTHHPQAIRATNLRTYEVTGCGAFLLSDRREDLLRLYREDEEFVGFDSADELREKITYYLAHAETRVQIARRGQQRAHAEHTYEQRLCQVLARV